MTVLEHIKQLALNLAPEEKDDLAQYLAESNGEKPPEKLQSLRGDWSDAPPRARELGGAALHAVCDVLERELQADSVSLPAAHNPQLLGEPFNDCLRSFWESM